MRRHLLHILIAASVPLAGAAAPARPGAAAGERPDPIAAAPGAARGDAADSATSSRPDSLSAAESFPVVLASFATTLIGSTAARTANVRLATAALDGQVIAPGEELSFNRVVGARTPERGYRDAPVILREARQMQPGGGVCQVASTLFTAGLLAGLTPVERHRHSSPVDYIALGEDATIAYGAKDLRLRNDLDQPVRVRLEVVGLALSVRVEGLDELADRYELETESRELPVTTSDGAGLPGREIELYRVRHGADGTLDRELVERDVYPPSRPAGEKRSP